MTGANSMVKWELYSRNKALVKIIQTYCLLVLIISSISYSYGQEDLHYLSTLVNKQQRDSIMADFIRADTIFSVSDRVFSFDIYMFGGEFGNYLKLDSYIIDTSKFSLGYFVRKEFVHDLIEKDKSCSESLIRIDQTFIYNDKTEHTLEFMIERWKRDSKEDSQLNSNKYLYDCFPQKFYDFIGSLLYNGTVDYVFSYPTHIHYDEGIIGTILGLYFGVKGNDVYAIIDNWTEENRGNEPRIIPIGQYLDCCWEKVFNMLQKEKTSD